MKEITMIIPTYKPDYYIWECLESVKKQTLNKNKYEVLIILNGEKEPYYTAINKYIYSNRLDNFKLLYINEKGVSNARNIGLNIAKGKYITFLDDDDIVDKEYLEAMLNIQLEKNSIVVVESINFYNKAEFDKNVKKTEIKKYKIIEKRSVFSVVWGKLIPKEVIENKKFDIKYRNSEDSLFMMEISKNIKKIYLMEGKIYYYRRVRENSASFKKMSKRYILNINLCMIKEYTKLFFRKKYNKIFVLLRLLAIIKGTIFQLRRNKNNF